MLGEPWASFPSDVRVCFHQIFQTLSRKPCNLFRVLSSFPLHFNLQLPTRSTHMRLSRTEASPSISCRIPFSQSIFRAVKPTQYFQLSFPVFTPRKGSHHSRKGNVCAIFNRFSSVSLTQLLQSITLGTQPKMAPDHQNEAWRPWATRSQSLQPGLAPTTGGFRQPELSRTGLRGEHQDHQNHNNLIPIGS